LVLVLISETADLDDLSLMIKGNHNPIRIFPTLNAWLLKFLSEMAERVFIYVDAHIHVYVHVYANVDVYIYVIVHVFV
jgi:hypothetical protein